MDAETGWYNFGKRYLDPKVGLWLSADPALSEYLPNAPLTDDDKKHNGNLPGMGGIYNPINFALYHFAGNNPIRYTDPDGSIFGIDNLVGAAIGGIISAGAEVAVQAVTGKYDAGAVALAAGTGFLLGALTDGLTAGGSIASATTRIAAAQTLKAVAAEQVAAAARATASKVLGANLLKAGFTRPLQSAAHHIVAFAAERAAPARAILEKFGIDINEAANGVFLPTSKEAALESGATLHTGMHTKDYYDAVNDLLGSAKSKAEAMEILGYIRDKLLAGGLE